ncbi:MAG: hypothetical protein ACFWUC_09670 [Oscillospiraceae bacterium]
MCNNGFFGCGNNSCTWVIILLIIWVCCSGGNYGYGCGGCGDNCGGCGGGC